MGVQLADAQLPDLTGSQGDPPGAVVLGCLVAAALCVLVGDLWRVCRNVVTMAHEGGHVLVALLVGRRLHGILLHSDASGLTVSRGRPSGPGMVATAFAGYVGASVLGLVFAALLGIGRITGVLWITVVLLGALLILVRNAYGVATILVSMAVAVAVSWVASSDVQAVLAYTLTWFLLLGGLKSVVELQRQRRRGRGWDSDPDQLARLTGVPALMWVALYALVGLASLIFALSWLTAVPWHA